MTAASSVSKSFRIRALAASLALLGGLFAVMAVGTAAPLTAGNVGGSSGTTGAGLAGGGGSSGGTPTGSTSNDSGGGGPGTCEGKSFNPSDDPDWNNLYPISWGSSTIGGSTASNPPWMAMPAMCNCQSHFWDTKMPGIGITYWEPLSISEIQREPGCMSTWGGTMALTGYGHLKAAGNESRDDGEHYNRMQVHSYTYPLLSIVGLFEDFVCLNSAAFLVTGMTEVNSVWNLSSGWQSSLDPRSVLTATAPAQAACGTEATLLYSGGWHINYMDWCIGGWGASSVLGGDINVTNSSWHSNGLTFFKYRQMQASFGNVWTTIGTAAQCASFPSPIMDKSQVRYNQIYPWPLKGKPIRMGDQPLGLSPTTTNGPTKDSTGVLVWEGKQCCMRF